MRQSKIRQIIVRTLSFSPKKEAETEEFHFEYKLWLNKEEKIVMAAIDLEEVGFGTRVNSSLKVAGGATIDPTSVSVLIAGGEAGKAYRIICTIKTSDGREERTEGLLAVT